LPEAIRHVLEPEAPTIDLTTMVAEAAGESVALDDLPGELRSRIMAATGNAQLRVIAKRRGSDGSAGADAYEVYALAGDRFVHMALALRPDGSVEETTETLLADEIHAVEIEP